jgi:hypothetical protein
MPLHPKQLEEWKATAERLRRAQPAPTGVDPSRMTWSVVLSLIADRGAKPARTAMTSRRDILRIFR